MKEVRIIKPTLTTADFPAVIFWEGKGYYYHSKEGWKRSSDQNRMDINPLRKYFDRKGGATKFGLKVI